MRTLMSIALACVLASLGPDIVEAQGPVVSSQTEKDIGRLQFEVFTCFGDSIPNTSVIFAAKDRDGRNYSVALDSDGGTALPYGEYEISIGVTGFNSWRRRIHLWEPYMSFAVGLQVGSVAETVYVPGPRKPLLAGTIIGQRTATDGRVIARLTGVFCADTVEAIVAADGKFIFFELPEGVTTLVVSSEGRILAARAFVFSARPQPAVEIEVGEGLLFDFERVLIDFKKELDDASRLPRYLNSYAEQGEGISYSSASFDLNGDGTEEVIVYLKTSGWCGRAGCTTLVLKPRDDTFDLVSKIAVSNLPIIALPRSSNGWRHLAVRVAGGGTMTPYHAELPFDGLGYAENPTIPPARQMTEELEGEVLIDR